MTAAHKEKYEQTVFYPKIVNGIATFPKRENIGIRNHETLCSVLDALPEEATDHDAEHFIEYLKDIWDREG